MSQDRALRMTDVAAYLGVSLGHASVVTLDIYSHVVPSMKADATQLVADQFSAKR